MVRQKFGNTYSEIQKHMEACAAGLMESLRQPFYEKKAELEKKERKRIMAELNAETAASQRKQYLAFLAKRLDDTIHHLGLQDTYDDQVKLAKQRPSCIAHFLKRETTTQEQIDEYLKKGNRIYMSHIPGCN